MARLTSFELEKVMVEVAPKAKEMITNSEIVWDGANWVWIRKFNTVGRELFEEISNICRDANTDDYEPCDDDDCVYCTTEYGRWSYVESKKRNILAQKS